MLINNYGFQSRYRNKILTFKINETTLTFSGKLSGTATNIKNTSKMAIAVAKATTTDMDHLKRNKNESFK